MAHDASSSSNASASFRSSVSKPSVNQRRPERGDRRLHYAFLIAPEVARAIVTACGAPKHVLARSDRQKFDNRS
jgi:hypothetical protein